MNTYETIPKSDVGVVYTAVTSASRDLVHNRIQVLGQAQGQMSHAERFPGEEDLWVHTTPDGVSVCYQTEVHATTVWGVWGALTYRREAGDIIPGLEVTEEGLRPGMCGWQTSYGTGHASTYCALSRWDAWCVEHTYDARTQY